MSKPRKLVSVLVIVLGLASSLALADPSSVGGGGLNAPGSSSGPRP